MVLDDLRVVDMNDSNTSYSLWYQVLQMPKLLKNFKGKLIYLLRYVTKPFLPLGKTRGILVQQLLIAEGSRRSYNGSGF